jgi:hypothetical protein
MNLGQPCVPHSLRFSAASCCLRCSRCVRASDETVVAHDYEFSSSRMLHCSSRYLQVSSKFPQPQSQPQTASVQSAASSGNVSPLISPTAAAFLASSVAAAAPQQQQVRLVHCLMTIAHHRRLRMRGSIAAQGIVLVAAANRPRAQVPAYVFLQVWLESFPVCPWGGVQYGSGAPFSSALVPDWNRPPSLLLLSSLPPRAGSESWISRRL